MRLIVVRSCDYCSSGEEPTVERRHSRLHLYQPQTLHSCIIVIIELVWFMWHRLNSYKTTLQCRDESHSNSSSSHVQLELYHASGKLREKSSVLSSRLKAGRVVDEITSTGRAFQTRAAMTRRTAEDTLQRLRFLLLLTYLVISHTTLTYMSKLKRKFCQNCN